MDSRSRRFEHHSRDEISEKKTSTTPKNTIKANLKAARAFRAYLEECNDHPDVCFESFSAEKLNDALEGFWLGARKQKSDGETPGSIRAGTGGGGKQAFYKASTLENLRHSLNRYLKSPPNEKGFDIIKDKEFSASNESFKAALRELKDIGKGEISHHPEIAEIDLQKLYNNFESLQVQDPVVLQEKVQFDIRFYFFRRGAENMHGMTKSTFAIRTDVNTGRRCVYKAIDELNKNHNEFDRESYTALMPELPGNPRCPVRSFETYIQHLNPDCPSLWQRPKDKDQINNHIWFYKKCVGLDTLQSFMKNLSQKYQLSQVYTNHCVRVTGATILSRKKFAASQIQAVTGHKSVSSLAIYQRVSDQEKMDMGRSLSENLMDRMSVPDAGSHAQQPHVDKIRGQQPLNTLDVNTLPEIGIQSGTSDPSDSRSRPGPSSSVVPSNLHPTNTLQRQRPPHTATVPQEPQPPEDLPMPDFDLDFSPILRDLEDVEVEQQTREINNMGNFNQVITTSQRVNIRSPSSRAAMPSFTGCTIHNLVVNVYPKNN